MSILITIGLFLFLFVSVFRKNYNFTDADIANVISKWRPTVSKYLQYFPPLTLEDVLAFVVVESNGDSNAVGDVENFFKAHGLMQVRAKALADYNKYFGKNYSMEDLFVPYIGLEVGMGYWKLRFLKWNDFNKAVRAYNTGDLNPDSAKGFEYQYKIDSARSAVKRKLSLV